MPPSRLRMLGVCALTITTIYGVLYLFFTLMYFFPNAMYAVAEVIAVLIQIVIKLSYLIW